MKAIAYYRVSSKQQEEKQSISLQENKIKRFSQDQKYKIVDEFKDDGISCESVDSRPKFQKALQRIEKGDVDLLLVYMIDRIGRFASRKDRNRVIELLEESKTSVHSPYDGLFRWDNEKELNNLESALNESRWDNVKRGIRISEAHLTNRLNGKYTGGRVPYGIEPANEKRNKFRKNKKEYETLKVIFAKLRSGWGVDRTAQFLNKDLDKYPRPSYTKTYRRDIPAQGIKKGDAAKIHSP